MKLPATSRRGEIGHTRFGSDVHGPGECETNAGPMACERLAAHLVCLIDNGLKS